jgi:hypothetical protein
VPDGGAAGFGGMESNGRSRAAGGPSTGRSSPNLRIRHHRQQSAKQPRKRARRCLFWRPRIQIQGSAQAMPEREQGPQLANGKTAQEEPEGV